jgi:hypothetical protein
MGLRAFFRRRLGQDRVPEREWLSPPPGSDEPPDDDEARIPRGSPRGPLPGLSAELLTEEPTSPTEACGRDDEQ